jgi:hypothetical protein
MQHDPREADRPLLGVASIPRSGQLGAMFTDAQMRALFEIRLNRMVEIGWLHSFRFTDGKGFHLEWTASGAQRALLLNAIIRSFWKNDDDGTAVAFTKLAKGTRLVGVNPAFDIDEDVARLWTESVDLLDLDSGDEAGLLALVHIILQWCPTGDTPIRFSD